MELWQGSGMNETLSSVNESNPSESSDISGRSSIAQKGWNSRFG